MHLRLCMYLQAAPVVPALLKEKGKMYLENNICFNLLLDTCFDLASVFISNYTKQIKGKTAMR